MPKKSAGTKITRKRATEIPPAAKADLDRLHAAMKGDIDTTEIPERRKFERLRRDANGLLVAKPSMIRQAVAREMKRLDLTVYRLWKLAREQYPPMSQSAVHEFLKGQRQLELSSIEALLAALRLHLVRNAGPDEDRQRKGREIAGGRK